ncbi:MAG TPA: hypothetical protein VIK61_08215 [Acidimicrobiia bacterium]
MTETTQRDEVERRLGETLRAKAAQVVELDAATFDAATFGGSGLGDLVATTPRTRRRVVAIAAVLTVAAAATASVLVMRARPHGSIVATESSVPSSSTPTTAPPSPPNPIAAPLVAPSWLPDGQQLWSLTSSTQGGTGFPTQLFGTVAADGTLAPGLLVELQPASPGDGLGGSGTHVTVRGQNGLARASKDAGDAPFEIDWIERGAYVRVTVRGATADQAVTALDALRPRGGSLMTGFEPASAPAGYPLLGERLMPAPDVSATFEYSAAPPTTGATPDFTVLSDMAGSYPGYLRIWMAGHRAPDGTTVELDPGVGFYVAWPDGRDVVVESDANHPDPTVLEHIARSATKLDKAAAAALAAEAQARVDALPWLGDAPLASGEITLRGTGSATAVCFQVLGADPACSNPFSLNAGVDGGGSNGALPGYAGSAAIGGTWYVFVAASAEPSFSVNGGRDTALPAETGRIGDTHVAVVAVPDGVDHVEVLVPTGPGQGAGTGFSRPSG